MFFDNKVSTQQHFESRLFWKNAEKLRKHASLPSHVDDRNYYVPMIDPDTDPDADPYISEGNIQFYLFYRKNLQKISLSSV